jgi:hypothetical protein
MRQPGICAASNGAVGLVSSDGPADKAFPHDEGTRPRGEFSRSRGPLILGSFRAGIKDVLVLVEQSPAGQGVALAGSEASLTGFEMAMQRAD